MNFSNQKIMTSLLYFHPTKVLTTNSGEIMKMCLPPNMLALRTHCNEIGDPAIFAAAHLTPETARQEISATFAT